ncbi:PfkB family carbohydrate kinase [Modestobacter sp. VKM Ac-2978]|uniref:PfkB family carbohydrate kinase n=1 Tax=Modestobacter sp. VKM Ac-2978 TaxID=3004132 RepID=UPI0022AB35AA|nr:PfkB family carbohydrate kinase [Modestobacter sp. VKM Ac-2978]MCZ2848383.1 PfkB family carbohydrate kinase [Modestobacter sp. VKM Ac-2978]
MPVPEGPAVVVGQVGRDLVLEVDRLPRGGRSADVRRRRELLGGKGANQAVAMAQLGWPVALVGVLGDDPPGDLVLAQAVGDGLWVSGVVRRGGAETALLVDLVEAGGTRRLLEDVPEPTLLTAADVDAAARSFARASAVVLQLQQPGVAVRAALARAPRDALTVADGAPPDPETREALLGQVRVLRADLVEAGLWVDGELDGLADVRAAARQLCAAGPRVVCLAAGEDGDLTVWREPGGRVREELVPLLGQDPVDPTGAGDSVVAAFTVALLRGADPGAAAWQAGAAAALTVGRLGGRPALDPEEVTRLAVECRERGGTGR